MAAGLRAIGRPRVRANLWSHLLASGFAALGLAAWGLPAAQAALMASLAPQYYQAHVNLAKNPAFQFTVAIESTTLDGTKVRVGGVAIAPHLILTAGHGIPSPGSTAVVSSVRMGENVYATNAVSLSIATSERYSGYIPGNTNTLDFGLVYLKEPIPGFTTPVSFGPATVGQTLTLVDYGPIAQSGDTASSPSLGDRMAGTAPVSNYKYGYPLNPYFNTYMDHSPPANSMDVKGIPGVSGSPFYGMNPDGSSYIAGIAIAASNNISWGYTYGLRTDNPVFLNFVTPKIAASWAAFAAANPPKVGIARVDSSVAVSWPGPDAGWRLRHPDP